MPTFNITGPDGKKYRVTGENAEGALNALRKSLDTGESQQSQDLRSDLSAMTQYPDTANHERSRYALARANGFDPDDESSNDLIILRTIITPEGQAPWKGKPYLLGPRV